MSSVDKGARNKALIEEFRRRLWTDGDVGVVEELIAADAIAHWGDSESDAQAIRAEVERYLTAFTDVRTSIEELVGENDLVVVRWNTTGTHTGRYGKVPPTGRVVTMRGVDFYRLEDGRIVEVWSMWDALDAYQQLGLVEPDVGP
jgi:steroid delta-isomerase-like uncharacterized protein